MSTTEREVSIWLAEQPILADPGRINVRTLTICIAGSAVVHVVALWWAPRDDQTALAAVEPPRVELIDIALPTPSVAAPATTPMPVATRSGPAIVRSAPRIATTVATIVPDEPVRDSRPTDVPSMSLRMRGGIDLRTPSIGIDVPGVVAPSGNLDGDIQRHIVDHPRTTKPVEAHDDNFSIHVDDNGTAHVTRKPDTTAHLTVPTLADIGDGIAEWWKVEKFTDQDYMTLTGDKIAERHGVHTIATPGGGDLPFLIPVLGGNFDLTPGDAYAAHKQQMLDASRDERAVALAAQRSARLADAARGMTANLARMWAATSPAARKQALFEMWDECAETGDEAAIHAGAEARAAVYRFIRDHAVVFAPSEIEDLNRHHHSSARFDPR